MLSRDHIRDLKTFGVGCLAATLIVIGHSLKVWRRHRGMGP